MRKKSYYILLFLFLESLAASDDFIAEINNPSKKYEMGHWVIYEMNVGAFSGTFNNAIPKLQSLKELGIDIIWLMPIYVRGGYEENGCNSPYASKNLMGVNPNYGNLSDLKNFVSKAHELNMQVWFDWVPAHTANNHPWLTQHRDYYIPGDNLHPSYPDVSQLYYENEELCDTMTNILKYWIREADIDGYRVDFISCPYVTNDYWVETIPALKNYIPGKTITMLGEADFTDQTRFYGILWDYDYAWWFQETALWKTMKNNTTDAGKLKNLCDNYIYDERYSALNRMVYLTNHDVNYNHHVTLSGMYGDNKYIFTVLYFTLYGMPLIYNSQEIGGEQEVNYFTDSRINWDSVDSKMYNTIKTLTALKHSEKAIQDGKNKDERGKIIWIKSSDSIAAYLRRTEDREALIVLNLGEEKDFQLSGVTSGEYMQWIDSSTIGSYISRKIVNFPSNPTIHLERKGYAVYVLQSNVVEWPPAIPLSDTNIFNNIINLDFRAGHFAKNRKGDLIIEYSGDPQIGKRLFYGFKKNGRGFFDDKYIREKNLDSTYGRYEARNIFISLKEDINHEKEYLFSTSSYQSYTELHDLENDECKIKYSDDFNGKRIFSYVYTLLETSIDNYNYYFLIFTGPTGDINDETGDNYTVTKFTFTNNDFNSYERYLTTNKKFPDRVISGFIIEEYKILVIFYLRKWESYGKLYCQYRIRFFNYDLTKEGNDFCNYNDELQEGKHIKGNIGIYSNAIYLNNRIGLFVYFHIGKMVFQCFQFNKNSDGNFYTTDVFYNEFIDKFDFDVVLNDVHKISEDRVAVVSSKNHGQNLYIIIIDFFDSSFKKRKFRIYNLKLFNDYKLKKELAVYSHENFLIFSTTIGLTNTGDQELPYSSFFLFFSYPNGTDFEIDISPYLSDSDNYDSTKNLYSYLKSTLKMENNLFRSVIVDNIKLVKIPNEILFYKSDNTLLQNGNLLDADHIIKQNKNLIKTSSQLYYLHYQFIAKEPAYEELYNSDIEVVLDNDYRSLYNPKVFYGRENKLSFKLCHDYCETCYSLGMTNDDQYCQTCLPDYTYDYLTYKNNFTGNCVPYGEMYDFERHKLLKCQDVAHKYYFNTSRENKKYCFKYDYECPDIYHYLNTSSNECLDYTPPTTIIKNIPTTLPKQVPSTLPKIIPTTLPEKITTTIPKIIPATLPEKITTTIPKIIPTIRMSSSFPDVKTSNIISTDSKIIYNCSYYTINNSCVFTNLTDEQILNKLKHDIVSTYPIDGASVIINGSKSYSFQVTNTLNERIIANRERETFSVDLGACEQTLKGIYNINTNIPLIILKYFNSEGSNNENNIQYELYHPTSYEKLNLSYCENDTLEVNIPVTFEDNFNNLFTKAKEQGYNLFNPDDPFYSKICTRYTSENGTDVLLDDRVSFYFNKVANKTTCPEKCKFLSYNEETQNLKCECGVMSADIETIDVNNIVGKNTYKSFYSTLKYSNYKVMRCYNLVFNFSIFKTNIGSILTLILLIISVIFMIYYAYKDINPIKIEISKILCKKEKIDKLNENQTTMTPEKEHKGIKFT